MARTEIRQTVITANWFHVGSCAIATEITRRRQVDAKRFHFGRCAETMIITVIFKSELQLLPSSSVVVLPVEIRNRRAGHFDVVAPQKKQQSVTGETYCVRDQNKLHRSLRFQFETFEKETAHENTDARSGYRDGT